MESWIVVPSLVHYKHTALLVPQLSIYLMYISRGGGSVAIMQSFSGEQLVSASEGFLICGDQSGVSTIIKA
jgi:hypothetical protein